MRARLALLVLGLAGVAATAVLGRRAAPSPPRAGSPAARPPATGAPAEPAARRTRADGDPAAAADPLAASIGVLQAALDGGQGGPAAAAALRRLLRTDPAAFVAATHLLLADDTEPRLRQALALVLGTVAHADTDAVLLAALQRFGDDRELVCCLIAALGAAREPADEDDVFDLAAAPHFGFWGPGGLGVTVRREIDDPAVQVELGRLLLDAGRAEVRQHAAEALRFSLAHDACRARFLSALANESQDATAGVLAAALGEWASAHPGLEAQQIAQGLLLPADRAGFDGYRLALETALRGQVLPQEQLERVRGWTALAEPPELRAFAFAVLAEGAEVSAADRAALESALADPDPPTRDLAARLLGGMPPAPSTIAALRAVFASGAEWNLRSAALAALASLLPPAAARELLAAAARDGDPRIARRAERLRQGLPR